MRKRGERVKKSDQCKRRDRRLTEEILLDSVPSTNTYAKEYAARGGSAPALFVAREQTAGRGRMGRSFFSSDRGGLYYSLLLPWPDEGGNALWLTGAAAVVTAEAIRTVFGVSVGIKWVNDIYLNEKKLAGILTEAFSVGEKKYALVGIGVNLYTEHFPAELADVAISLCPGLSGERAEKQREALICALTCGLLDAWEHPRDRRYMERYRQASVVLGREVRFTQNGVTREGVAESLDDGGGLWIAFADGSRQLLSSGEITLRRKDRK